MWLKASHCSLKQTAEKFLEAAFYPGHFFGWIRPLSPLVRGQMEQWLLGF